MPENQPTSFILVDLFSNTDSGDRVLTLATVLLVTFSPASVIIKAGVQMGMEMERVQSLARRSFLTPSTLPLQMDETEPVFTSGRAQGVWTGWPAAGERCAGIKNGMAYITQSYRVAKTRARSKTRAMSGIIVQY